MTIPNRPLGMKDILTEVYPAPPVISTIGLTDPVIYEVTGVESPAPLGVVDLEGKALSKGIHKATTAAMVNMNVHTFFDSPTTPGDFVLEILHEVSSSGAGTPALQSGALPAGSTLTLIVKAYIRGAGGRGAHNTSAPGAGGPAISTTVPTTIDVSAGYVWGGGGGGGAVISGSLGGGGGGAGKVAGSGGRVGAGANTAGNGSLTGGSGGIKVGSVRGGTGGGPGAAGGKGTGPSSGSGGAAGPAVRRNGHPVTWIGKTADRVRGPEV